MSCQHKRPGRTAKLERKRRIQERKNLKNKIIPFFPKRYDPERYDGISPGQCVAWADGRVI